MSGDKKQVGGTEADGFPNSVFHCNMPNHKNLNVPDCSQGRTTVQELG